MKTPKLVLRCNNILEFCINKFLNSFQDINNPTNIKMFGELLYLVVKDTCI